MITILNIYVLCPLLYRIMSVMSVIIYIIHNGQYKNK